MQWLLQYDVLFKRKLAIEKFSKGLETSGLLQCIKEYPNVFECCFVWNGEEVTSQAVLEMLEASENLDDTCSLIFDWFQEHILGLSTAGGKSFAFSSLLFRIPHRLSNSFVML